MHWATYIPRLLITLLMLGGLASCAPRAPEQGRLLSVREPPEWSETRLETHLRALNSLGLRGRATGTQAFARTATYVAERLRETGVQPAFVPRFQTIYQTPVHTLRATSFRLLNADTTALLPGIDYLVDGYSDGGELRLQEITVFPDSAEAPRGVALVDDLLSRDEMAAWRARGVRGLVLVGALQPRQATRPIEGLLIVQMTPAAVARLLGPRGAAALRARREQRFQLPVVARLRVEATYMPQAGAINTIGYLAGRHPVYANEAVLVCADMDAVAQTPGVRALGLENLGAGAAALIEVARIEASLARYLNVPERTLIVAFWSGSKTGHAGLQSYLRQPTWALARTRSVIYIGLSREEEAQVRALLTPYGLPLYAVALPEAQQAAFARLEPDETLQRLARLRRDDTPAPEGASDVLDLAAEAAMVMARRAHALVLREAMTAAPLLPTLPDTLIAPSY